MDNLLDLIKRASTSEADGRSRMEAVHTLKSAALTRWDVQALTAAVENEENPAYRAAAAQVLGYHMAHEMVRELEPVLMERVKREQDPGVLRALAFALRDRDGTRSLLSHRRPEVREEAMLGIPLSGDSLRALLDHFFQCRDGNDKARIAGRFRGAPIGVLGEIVDFLLSGDIPEGGGFAADVEVLLEPFPQEDIFQELAVREEEIRRTHREIWPGIRRRERRRALVEVSRKLILDGPSPGLLEHLLRRLRDEESFYHENVRFLRQVFGGAKPEVLPGLMSSFRKLGEEARGGALIRLAEMLSVVFRALPSCREESEALLQAWAKLAPEVGLRLYHRRLQAPRATN